MNAQGTEYVQRFSDLTLVQWRILLAVKLMGDVRPKDITSELEMDKGLFSRNLKALTDQGLVRLERNVKDNRQVDLLLSEAGNEVYEKTIPIMWRRQVQLLNGFTEDEASTFLRGLDRVRENASYREIDDRDA